jgi:hypothetical protein
MSIKALQRRATLLGYANPDSAPLYVNSTDNTIHIVPVGSGSTEIAVVDVSSAQTLTNKTLSGPTFSGPILAPDGTAAAPSFAFASVPGTGLSKTGAASLAFSTSSVIRWYINATGGLAQSSGAGIDFWNSGGALNADGANVLALRNAGAAQELRIGPSPGYLPLNSTPPTITSGFNTSPSVTNGTSFSFAINTGTTPATNTAIISLPTMPNGWSCQGQDLSDGGYVNQVASTVNSASFKYYSRTTGLAINWPASATIVFICAGR